MGGVVPDPLGSTGGNRRRARPDAILGLVLGAAAVALAFSAAAAPEIAVVMAPDSTGVPADQAVLADIYRGRIVVDDQGQAYVPVNLPAWHGLRRAFSRGLFASDPEDLEQYWNEQYFHGVSPPFVVESTEAVVRFVSATAGAIGYVLDCEADSRVKIVMRLPLSHDEAGAVAICSGTDAGR